MAKVSIIIPVYNVEQYVKRCIESIIEQSLTDIEIILVDDGSTDGSGNLCDAYATIDDRIKVIHKKNEGLSCARNDGIDIATSPYIMFVDSDDWVERDFCKLPYEIAKDKNADLILFTYNRIYSDGRIEKVDSALKSGILNENNALRFNVNYSPAAWLGFYRKELFGKIRYPAGKYYEEYGTTHRLIHISNRIYFLKNPLYNYWVDRNDSITNNPITKEHPDRCEMIIRRIDDLCSWGYLELTKKDAFSMLVKYGCKNSQKHLIEIFKMKEGHIPETFSWKKRWMLHVLKISPPLFDALCIIMGNRVS